MDINTKFNYVSGAFDTKKGKLECVNNSQFGSVHLCFKAGMNIPFAKIRLHSDDLLVDAKEVEQDAINLGNEIVKRWNAHNELIRVLSSVRLSIKAHPDYQLERSQEFIDYVEIAEELINKIAGHDR